MNEIKVSYTALDGSQQTAYVDAETLVGVEKHTDEPVTLELRYFEIKGDN